MIGILSAGVMLLELSVSRLFAYALPYHFTAVAISLAMLGLGSGAWLRVSALKSVPSPALLSGGLTALAAFTAVFCGLLYLKIPAWLLIAGALPPTVCLGALIADRYAAAGKNGSGRAYVLDLTGACAACLAAPLLLEKPGALGTLLALAAAAALGGAWAGGFRPRRLAFSGVFLLPFAAWAAGVLPDPWTTGRAAAAKPLHEQMAREGGRILDFDWSAAGRADLYEVPAFANIRWIYNDASNSTFLVADPATLERKEFLKSLFPALPFAILQPQDALIIGPGGGLEIHLARLFGAETVDGEEINPAIVRLVKKHAAFAGPVYDRPGVRLAVAEGRRFHGKSKPRSLIMLSLVFTATAQPASLALAENFLYTKEAFDLYLSRLRPGGMLAILDDSPHRSLRQAATALAALQARGLDFQEALSRIAVIRDPAGQTGYQYLLMVVPEGPPAPLWAAARAESRRRNLAPLWLAGERRPPYDALAARGLREFLNSSPLELGPPSDNAPFFFDFTKGPARLAPLLPLLALGAGALGAAFAFALRGRSTPDRRRFALAALLGCAFMLVESALLQRLTLAAGTPAAILSTLLASLLFWCALGGPLGRRLSGGKDPSLGSALALAAAAAALGALALPKVYALAWVQGAGPRAAALFLLLAPLGLALGRPFPALLRAAGTDEDRAALWGVNGLASVGGASLALCASFLFGADAALWLGAVLYAGGAVISSSEKGL